jgi:spore maturation protein CgeB
MNAGADSSLLVAIAGNSGGTHVGESFRRAAARKGIPILFFDASEGYRGNRFLRSLSWQFGGKRPLALRSFSNRLIDACRAARPHIFVSTGASPVNHTALQQLRSMSVICINYSTDDPWNPSHFAKWHLRSLPFYHIVFTPRLSNISDLKALGCSDVRYLPFAYDEALFGISRPEEVPSYDVFFAGGADRDRVNFMSSFVASGLKLGLAGGYWDNYPLTRPYALGLQNPTTLQSLTATAKVNLCLVRRANRDGHVMRSFEIAASGGCMLVEDTVEHRKIFGADGDAVFYFRTSKDALERAKSLVGDPEQRARLAKTVRKRIIAGRNTYSDRFHEIVESARILHMHDSR